jgi:hypothetical protein
LWNTHSFCEAVGEIDREQPVGAARCIDHGLHFRGGAAQRLLAEHGHAALQRADRLLGVQGAGGRDHHAVHTGSEDGIEVGHNLRIGRELAGLLSHFGRGIGDGRHIHRLRLQDGLHAVAADPADAKKTQARTRKFRSLLCESLHRHRVTLVPSWSLKRAGFITGSPGL